MSRYTSEEQKQMGGDILRQMGGLSNLQRMTGAKQFAVGENDEEAVFIVFKIGRNTKRVNYVKITLNSMDLYDVQYSDVNINRVKVKVEEKGIYSDMLKRSFEINTGMYLSFH